MKIEKRNKRSAALILLGIFFLCWGGGCGIDSTDYIEAPIANASTQYRYSFKHTLSKATGLYGYEILYRFYTDSTDMQADYATIEQYRSTIPTGAYSKMIQSLGYQRITPPEFNDMLVQRGEYNGNFTLTGKHSNLDIYDAEISLDFTSGLESVAVSVNDGVNSMDSQAAYRGSLGPVTNQGKGFDAVKLSDGDVRKSSTQTQVYIQAYAFAVGVSTDAVTYYYSTPSFLGSNIVVTVVM